MKNNNHFLSVIIPVYKQEKTIQEDLKNIYQVLEQIRYDFEIIIVVDGTKVDNSYSLVKKLKFKNIKGVYQYE